MKIRPEWVLFLLAWSSSANADDLPRPNHTLPQYAAGSATTTATPLFLRDGIRKDMPLPQIYADNTDGTLAQIGQMADGSVQQTDVGVAFGVAPLDGNKMMSSPVSGDVSAATYARTDVPSQYTTTVIGGPGNSPCVWVSNGEGAGWQSGDVVTYPVDGSTIQVTSVDGNGAITGYSVQSYGSSPKNYAGIQHFIDNPHSTGAGDNTHLGACFKISQTVPMPWSSQKNTVQSPHRPLSVLEIANPDYVAPAALSNLLFSEPTPYAAWGNGPFKNSVVNLTNWNTGALRGLYLDLNGADTTQMPVYPVAGVEANSYPYAGDSIVAEFTPSGDLPQKKIVRVDSGGVENTLPIVEVTVVNDDPNHGARWQGQAHTHNARFNTVVSQNAVGSTVGLANYYEDHSNQGYQMNDYGWQNTAHIYGTSWFWGNATEVDELGGTDFTYNDRGIPSAQLTTSVFETENNLNSVGYESHASAWSGDWRRTNQLFSNGTFPNYVPFWGASTAFDAHKMIRVPNPATGAQYLYVTDAGGTTGTQQPAFTFSETGPISDGSVSWMLLGPLKTQVGVGAEVSTVCANANYPSGYTGPVITSNDCVEVGSAFLAKGNFYNTVFDASNVSYTSAGAHIALRVTAGSYMDLTANATQAGLDNHILGYDNAAGGLAYKIKTSGTGASEVFSTLLLVRDNGSVSLNGPLSVSQLINGGAVTANYDISAGGNIKTGASLYLGKMTKSAILSLYAPTEGQKIYDTDDHTEVTYRCPTSGTCGWFPVQYGAALSD